MRISFPVIWSGEIDVFWEVASFSSDISDTLSDKLPASATDCDLELLFPVLPFTYTLIVPSDAVPSSTFPRNAVSFGDNPSASNFTLAL